MKLSAIPLLLLGCSSPADDPPPIPIDHYLGILLDWYCLNECLCTGSQQYSGWCEDTGLPPYQGCVEHWHHWFQQQVGIENDLDSFCVYEDEADECIKLIRQEERRLSSSGDCTGMLPMECQPESLAVDCVDE